MKKFLVLVFLSLISVAASAQTPAQKCQQSLLSAYESVPMSIYNRCSYTNTYSARAIHKFSRTYTTLSLPVVDVLLAVRSPKDLKCVEYIANNYSSVDSTFIARVCFRAIELNY